MKYISLKYKILKSKKIIKKIILTNPKCGIIFTTW